MIKTYCQKRYLKLQYKYIAGWRWQDIYCKIKVLLNESVILLLFRIIIISVSKM